MSRGVAAFLLFCAIGGCGTRTGLITEDREPDDARVRDTMPPMVRDTGVRDTSVRDTRVPDDVGVPSCPCMGEALLADTPSPTAIAVDRTHVYWTSSVSGCAGGTINRVPKCGGPVEVLASDEPNPRAIAVDDDRVYYYDACGSGILRSVPKAGGPIQNYMISVMDSGRALAVGGDDIYFSDYGLLRIPKAGGSQTVINDRDYVYAVAADDRGAYWIGPIGGGPTFGVFSYQPGDAGSTTLAMPSDVSNDVAIDDDAIFFFSSRGISRIPREGGVIARVTDSRGGQSLVVDERFVYWTVGFAGSGGYTISKAPKSGGDPVLLAEGEGAYLDLAVDERCVYATNQYGDEVRSFPK